MRHDPQKYLFDMLGACDFLLGFTKGRSLDDYRNDRAFRSAIERELQIIGEALLQLDRVSSERADQIPEKASIIGFRHVLVHGYDSLMPETVWNIIEVKLGPLADSLRRLTDHQ